MLDRFLVILTFIFAILFFIVGIAAQLSHVDMSSLILYAR